MTKTLDQVVFNEAGKVIGFVYAAGGHFEAWKRVRLSDPLRGNSHTRLGFFDKLDVAIAAVQSSHSTSA